MVATACMSVAEVKSKDAVSDDRTKSPIIIIDNYDSFTYNICQYTGELGCNFEVYRNDELSVEELKGCTSRFWNITANCFRLGPIVPLFGECMGLQCIGEAFGGSIVHSPYGVRHGKGSLVCYDEKEEDGLFTGCLSMFILLLPRSSALPFYCWKIHSLFIEKDSFPSEELEVTTWSEDGLIMATRHKKI
ncbi:Glutamine amidotransferase [Dillenia turbinata]|uniref:anthranilate synthase n=1 Tax=Dillenia turbinata TaxID=194707 RepID=A0AAN8UTK4_9MAGN